MMTLQRGPLFWDLYAQQDDVTKRTLLVTLFFGWCTKRQRHATAGYCCSCLSEAVLKESSVSLWYGDVSCIRCLIDFLSVRNRPMPTSAVSRPRNPPVAAASRAGAAALPSSANRSARQRAGSYAASADDSGGQEETASSARSRATTSRGIGVERSRLGRVLQQQVRADVHGDPSARSTWTTTQQQQQQQQPGRTSRSTPATDTRRGGLPRSSADSGKCRARSTNSTATDVGRHAASAAADNDKTPLPRPSASSSTSNAEKSEEELEKMRILARHIKVRISRLSIIIVQTQTQTLDHWIFPSIGSLWNFLKLATCTSSQKFNWNLVLGLLVI